LRTAGSFALMKCLGLPDTMMTADRSRTNGLVLAPAGSEATRVEGAPRRPNGAVVTRVATFQRQTYEPFTSTRTQPEAAAPTAAPPTTARRVVRRATPATLTGVSGRPTLACTLSTPRERPSPGDQFIDASVPNARVAVANNACLILIFLIATSCAE